MQKHLHLHFLVNFEKLIIFNFSKTYIALLWSAFFLLTNFLPIFRSYGAQTRILVNDYKIFAPTELRKKTI